MRLQQTANAADTTVLSDPGEGDWCFEDYVAEELRLNVSGESWFGEGSSPEEA